MEWSKAIDNTLEGMSETQVLMSMFYMVVNGCLDEKARDVPLESKRDVVKAAILAFRDGYATVCFQQLHDAGRDLGPECYEAFVLTMYSEAVERSKQSIDKLQTLFETLFADQIEKEVCESHSGGEHEKRTESSDKSAATSDVQEAKEICATVWGSSGSGETRKG